MPPYVQLGVAIDQQFGVAWPATWEISSTRSSFRGMPRTPVTVAGRDLARRREPGARSSARMKVLETGRHLAGPARVEHSGLEAADTFYEKAYNLVTAPQAKKAFDIGREDPRIRDRYGRHSLGQGCLMARRPG